MARIYVEVPDSFHQAIKEMAIRRGISMKDMTIKAVDAWMKMNTETNKEASNDTPRKTATNKRGTR